MEPTNKELQKLNMKMKTPRKKKNFVDKINQSMIQNDDIKNLLIFKKKLK